MNVNIFITDFDSSIAWEKNKKIGACCNVTMPRDGSSPGSRNIQVLCGKCREIPCEKTSRACVMRSEVTLRHAWLLTSKPTNQMLFYPFVVAKINPKPASVLAQRALVLLARQSRVNHSPRSFFTLCSSKKLYQRCLPAPAALA